MSAVLLAAGAGLCAAVALHDLARMLEAAPAPADRGAAAGVPARAPRRTVPPALPPIAGAAAGGWLLIGVAGIAAGLALGLGAVHLLRRRERQGHARARERGTGPLARSLADALRAGHSIRGALAAAGDDRAVPAPVRTAVAASSKALAHGTPLDRALQGLAGGGGGQLALLAALVSLHAEQGGALVQQLLALADDAEQAARLDEERAGATAQARATVRTVAALPLLALVGAQLLGGDLLGAVAERPVALALLATGLLLELGAVLIARRIVARVA